MIYEVDDDSIEIFLTGPGAILVDVWADWCAPCKKLAPILEDLSKDLLWNDITFVKLDAADNPKFLVTAGVRTIPTLMLFQNGQLLAERTGFVDKETLEDWIVETLD